MNDNKRLGDLLSCAIQIVGRLAIPADKVSEIVGTKKKLIEAYNLCDGTRSQKEIVKKLRLDQGSFSKTSNRWVKSGVAFWIGDLEVADAESREVRMERLKFLLGEFGTPAGMMLTGGIGAVIAIGELQSSFLSGNYMATILCCQTFIEHSLAGRYALSGQDALVEIGFKDLIDRSLADGNLSAELAASLHELREMRNPYIHPRIRPNRESLLDRMVAVTRELESKSDRDSRDPIQIMAERDARDAIRNVVDYLRHGCPSWTPSKHRQ